MNIKIKFIPRAGAPFANIADGFFVNGFDMLSFPENGVYKHNERLIDAGVYDIKRNGGVLYVTLGEPFVAYECSPKNLSHDWHGTEEWIEADDYDPNRCYIVATSAPEGAEYVKRENGWTVTLPQAEEEPAP